MLDPVEKNDGSVTKSTKSNKQIAEKESDPIEISECENLTTEQQIKEISQKFQSIRNSVNLQNMDMSFENNLNAPALVAAKPESEMLASLEKEMNNSSEDSLVKEMKS